MARFRLGLLTSLLSVALLLPAMAVQADSRANIDQQVGQLLAGFRADSTEMAALLDQAAAVLVFPELVSMNFGEGGHYGEGSLLRVGQQPQYYATAGSTSAPSSAGRQARLIVFMTDSALGDFQQRRSWREGVDGDILFVSTSGLLLSKETAPMLELSYSGDGLSLHGNKFTRLSR